LTRDRVIRRYLSAAIRRDFPRIVADFFEGDRVSLVFQNEILNVSSELAKEICPRRPIRHLQIEGPRLRFECHLDFEPVLIDQRRNRVSDFRKRKGGAKAEAKEHGETSEGASIHGFPILQRDAPVSLPDFRLSSFHLPLVTCHLPPVKATIHKPQP
jgi:hypothetical protein